MHAAASELYDVSGAPPDSVTARQERIRTRFWFDSEVTIRRAAPGPIISDTPFFPGRPGETVALRWTGHEVSDEIGAFLAVMRAKTAGAFRQALAGYGVAGQNMLCATRTGDICQVMAVHLPIREAKLPTDLVRSAADPAAEWHGEADALTLPWALNPADGLLASANNRPARTDFPVGFFFQPSERVDRLYALLGAREKLSIEDLAQLQRDTLSLSSLALKTALIAAIRESGAARRSPDFIRTLESWDGRYEADQAGPVAFEMLLYELARRLYGSRRQKVSGVTAEWGYLAHYLPQDLAERHEPRDGADGHRTAIASGFYLESVPGFHLGPRSRHAKCGRQLHSRAAAKPDERGEAGPYQRRHRLEPAASGDPDPACAGYKWRPIISTGESRVLRL